MLIKKFKNKLNKLERYITETAFKGSFNLNTTTITKKKRLSKFKTYITYTYSIYCKEVGTQFVY